MHTNWTVGRRHCCMRFVFTADFYAWLIFFLFHKKKYTKCYGWSKKKLQKKTKLIASVQIGLVSAAFFNRHFVLFFPSSFYFGSNVEIYVIVRFLPKGSKTYVVCVCFLCIIFALENKKLLYVKNFEFETPSAFTHSLPAARYICSKCQIWNDVNFTHTSTYVNSKWFLLFSQKYEWYATADCISKIITLIISWSLINETKTK